MIAAVVRTQHLTADATAGRATTLRVAELSARALTVVRTARYRGSSRGAGAAACGGTAQRWLASDRRRTATRSCATRANPASGAACIGFAGAGRCAATCCGRDEKNQRIPKAKQRRAAIRWGGASGHVAGITQEACQKQFLSARPWGRHRLSFPSDPIACRESLSRMAAAFVPVLPEIARLLALEPPRRIVQLVNFESTNAARMQAIKADGCRYT